MGRTMMVAAALWTGSVLTAAAQQPPTPTPTPAPAPAQSVPELFKQGQDAASRGDLVTAIGAFQRALEMEPSNWEIELALADAERQSNQCDKAILRYKRLFETVPEGDRAKVKASATQCPNLVVLEEPAKAPPPPPPVAPMPTIIEKERSMSWVTVATLAGAGACLGSSIALYFAGRSSHSDAEDARSAADHDRISKRGDYQLIGSAVLAAGAIGLGTYGLIKLSKRSETTEVAVTPIGDGGAVMVRGAW